MANLTSPECWALRMAHVASMRSAALIAARVVASLPSTQPAGVLVMVRACAADAVSRYRSSLALAVRCESPLHSLEWSELLMAFSSAGAV